MDPTFRPSPAANAKVTAARLSIVSNSALVALKLVAGLLGGSVSVLSEAAHSATDLLASVIAFFSVRVSDLPADSHHPYGHGKAEALSGLAEAVLIFAAAAYIVVEGVRRLMGHGKTPDVDLGIAVMLVSVVANVIVSRHLFQVARERDSLALEADAEHLRTDVYTSAGVLVGLGLVRLTGWVPLDAIVAIVVAMVIVHAAWRLTRASVLLLMDAQLPDDDTALVRRVFDAEPAVLSYHKLRTRKSGSARLIDAHVQLDDRLTLVEAHALTEQLEDRIRADLPFAEVTLHTEPYHEELRHQHERHGGPPPDGLKHA
ncbi:MAG: cation transporter [Chthonomonadales bacterium]|nr:cation transporter [Chthonomonadales bacterium]